MNNTKSHRVYEEVHNEQDKDKADTNVKTVQTMGFWRGNEQDKDKADTNVKTVQTIGFLRG